MKARATEIASFEDIIGLWPSVEAMASEIGGKADTVRKWRSRGRIPEGNWHSVLESDRARKAGVTADLMVRLAARNPAEAR